MTAPLITVLIDTYNYGRFIEQAIESVLEQDFPLQQAEILVVDDGSTDDTAERVKKYGSRIRYFLKPNGGQASVFNFGIARAQGQYVALLDADDYWLPGKLQRVASAFAENPEVGLVYHAFRELVESTGESRDAAFSAISGWLPGDRHKLLQYTATQTSGLTFRTAIVKKLLPLNESIITQADGPLAALAPFLAPVKAIPEPLAVYRIHGKNLYQHGPEGVDPERQKRRIAVSRIELVEIDRCLAKLGFDLDQPPTLAFRQRWRLVLERDEFLLEPPGRLRFCWYLLRANRNMSPVLSRRIQLVNWLNALGALFFGYRRYDQLDQWRRQLKRLLLQSDPKSQL